MSPAAASVRRRRSRSAPLSGAAGARGQGGRRYPGDRGRPDHLARAGQRKSVGTGDADMIAIARTALYDPRWPWHAAAALGSRDGPPQYLFCPAPCAAAVCIGIRPLPGRPVRGQPGSVQGQAGGGDPMRVIGVKDHQPVLGTLRPVQRGSLSDRVASQPVAPIAPASTGARIRNLLPLSIIGMAIDQVHQADRIGDRPRPASQGRGRRAAPRQAQAGGAAPGARDGRGIRRCSGGCGLKADPALALFDLRHGLRAGRQKRLVKVHLIDAKAVAGSASPAPPARASSTPARRPSNAARRFHRRKAWRQRAEAMM